MLVAMGHFRFLALPAAGTTHTHTHIHTQCTGLSVRINTHGVCCGGNDGNDGGCRRRRTHRLSSGDRLSVKNEQFWLSISANLHTHTHTYTKETRMTGWVNYFTAFTIMGCNLHSVLPSAFQKAGLFVSCEHTQEGA